MAEEPETTTDAPAKKNSRGTEFTVLALDDRGHWQVVADSVRAASQKAAVKLYLKNQPEKDGTYVAPPARSWNPVVVEEEIQTRLKIT